MNPAAEGAVRASLPRGDRTISLDNINGTNLFTIDVRDYDANKAARRANDFANSMRKRFQDQRDLFSFKIWELAETPVR